MALLLKFPRLPVRKLFNCRRPVSTSSSKNDTTVVADACKAVEPKPNKNWMSYGFDRKNKSNDRFWTHTTFFFSVTGCLTIGSLYFAYMPDYTYRDWAQREAFIELRRREENGLPLVDPNLIDVNKIQLPSDEELGDTEIII